ncbi:VOC family protein [Sphingomonas oligophenolica]|uniref:VOC family protein n=1 Tax=Sphingomonas oligophenolica TaxID=301154 RepID=A0ABU9Y1J1_9SPHN
MYSHMMVGSNDIARSKRFYDALFGAIGGKPALEDDRGRLIYMHNGGVFMVTTPIDGAPAAPANGATIGFAMEGPAQADAWYRAGAENGGSPIEDPPGVREGGFGALYLAYLRDPDGNKLCALHRMPA